MPFKPLLRRRSLLLRPAALLVSLCVVLLLAACSGGEDSSAAGLTAASEGLEFSRGLPGISELQQLDELRPTSNVDYDLFNFGSSYSDLLASNRTSRPGPFPLQALFEPVYANNGSIGDAAYAIYQFRPYGMHGDLPLQFDWSIAPADNSLWIGIADPQQQRWRWTKPAQPSLGTLNPAGLVFQPSGYVYVAIMILGTQSPVLNSITLGDPGLQAVLSVDASGSSVNYDNSFDASASFSASGASLTIFEWDWEGDGSFEEATGANPANNHAYSTTGLHWPTVRVTQEDGVKDSATIPVFVYDEQEDNDNPLAADPLPALPFQSWVGSCGNADFFSNDSYDGDAQDISTLSASSGDVLHLRLQSFGESNQYMNLYDNGGNQLTFTVYDNLSTHTLNYTVQPADQLPLKLHIQSDPEHGGAAFYRLSATKDGLPQALLTRQITDTDFPVTVTFSGSGSVDSDGSIVLYEIDFDGDGIWDDSNSSGADFNYSYSAGFLPFVQTTLRVTDDDGNTDTDTLSFKLSDGSDEFEDNDGPLEASQIQSLPAQVTGSIGTGSYDGDNLDFWTFDPPQDGTVTVQLSFNRGVVSGLFGNSSSLENNIEMTLYDDEGDALTSTEGKGAPFCSMQAVLGPQDKAPLRVEVKCNDGGSTYTLRVGDGLPPSVILPSSSYSGEPQVELNFDATNTNDIGLGPYVYSWDFDGDGSFEISGTDDQVSYAYPAAGAYVGWLQIMDGDFLLGYTRFSAEIGISPGLFDESENNDNIATADPLPAGSVLNFTGNLGPAGSTDGDQIDYFSLGSPTAGTHIALQLRFVNDNDDLDLYLMDSLGNPLAHSNVTGSDYEVVNFTLGQFINLPLYVQVADFSNTGSSTYCLSGVYE